MIKIPSLRTMAQYAFLFSYFSALCAVVYMNSVSATPHSKVLPPHPLAAQLREIAGPGSEPWEESFIVDYREVYPIRSAEKDKPVEKFAFRIPSDAAASVQLLLTVHLDGRAARVIPLKVEAPFGFAEEFERQTAFFKAFEGREAKDILPADEGGVIPTVTGAAILSRQVIYAVREGVEFYLANRGDFGKIIRSEENTSGDSAVEVVISPPVETQENFTPEKIQDEENAAQEP